MSPAPVAVVTPNAASVQNDIILLKATRTGSDFHSLHLRSLCKVGLKSQNNFLTNFMQIHD